MAVARFFASWLGRGIRIVAGLVLVALGVRLGAWWLLLAALGAIFVIVGIVNVCLLAVLFGGPFNGRRALR